VRLRALLRFCLRLRCGKRELEVLAGQLLEGGEDAVGARIDLDRRHMAPEDTAVAVKDEQRAFGRPDVVAVDVEAPADLALGVKVGELSLPRFRGQVIYAASAPARKSASVSFGVL
jgi:hypothetical protein